MFDSLDVEQGEQGSEAENAAGEAVAIRSRIVGAITRRRLALITDPDTEHLQAVKAALAIFKSKDFALLAAADHGHVTALVEVHEEDSRQRFDLATEEVAFGYSPASRAVTTRDDKSSDTYKDFQNDYYGDDDQEGNDESPERAVDDFFNR